MHPAALPAGAPSREAAGRPGAEFAPSPRRRGPSVYPPPGGARLYTHPPAGEGQGGEGEECQDLTTPPLPNPSPTRGEGLIARRCAEGSGPGALQRPGSPRVPSRMRYSDDEAQMNSSSPAAPPKVRLPTFSGTGMRASRLPSGW
jgi:hypothetical protein